MRCGVNDYNDFRAVNIIENILGFSFDIYIHDELFGHFNLPFFGMHMLYNSLAIITLGYLENMSSEYIKIDWLHLKVLNVAIVLLK